MKRLGTDAKPGFTLVELLIVIVVIAILAAFSVVAYNGIQQRAHNSQQKNSVAALIKALELYYVDNGEYPNATNYTPGSIAINSSWSTTADGSWQNLLDELAPYAQQLPSSPPGVASTSTAMSGGNGYDYVGVTNSNYCGSSKGQMYLLIYRLQGSNENKTIGTCTGTQLGYYGNGSSNYRVVR